jgi:hypothetical protein
MEELHTDSIDGGHEASYGARSRARERAYSNIHSQKNYVIYGYTYYSCAALFISVLYYK